MLTGGRSLDVRGGVKHEWFQMVRAGYFMELSQRDFLKAVSGIRIFKVLGLERARNLTQSLFHIKYLNTLL